MQAYILFVCPALFIITADFCQYLIQLDNTKFKWVFNFIIILILITPIRYCIERLKPFEKDNPKNAITSSILQLKSRNFTNKDVLFNCNYPVEMMFYNNLTAYKGFPNVNRIEDLLKKGYHIYINNHEKIPLEIEKIKGVRLIDLGY